MSKADIDIIKEFTSNGYKCVVKRISYEPSGIREHVRNNPGIDMSGRAWWYTGYVYIPKGDKFYGADIDALEDIDDMRELDAKREWVEMNNAICGHNFTKIKFWPFEGKKSEIEIYPLYDGQDGGYLLYTNILGIERKWNHDIKGNELYIRLIDFGKYVGFHNIEKIIIVPEEDIKKFIIKRSDHEDLEIKVNGGTYRDE